MVYDDESILFNTSLKDLEAMKDLIDSLLAHLKNCVDKDISVQHMVESYVLLSNQSGEVPFDPDRGICSNIEDAADEAYCGLENLNTTLKYCFERYDKFSGSFHYPIGGCDEYEEPHWEGQNLFNRMSLLKFISSQLSLLIEKMD